MAAVRIEEAAFSDDRYDDLAEFAGLADADHARGKMARLWRQCTLEQVHTLPESTVRRVLGPNGVEAIVRARLGEVSDEGVRIRGTQGRIEWLGTLKDNGKYGKKGGRPRKGNPQGLGDANPSVTLEGSITITPPALALASALAEERELTRAIPGAPDTHRPPTSRPALPADRSGQEVAAHLLAEIRSHSPGYQLEAARQGEWAHLAVSVMAGGVSAADLKAAATHAHRGNPRFWASKVLGMRQLAEKAQDLLVEARTSKLERGAQGSSPAEWWTRWQDWADLPQREDRWFAEHAEPPPWWQDKARWRMTSQGSYPLRPVANGLEVPNAG